MVGFVYPHFQHYIKGAGDIKKKEVIILSKHETSQQPIVVLQKLYICSL